MIQRWKNYPFQSASYLTDEFKSFVKDLKKYILSKLPPGVNATLKLYHIPVKK